MLIQKSRNIIVHAKDSIKYSTNKSVGATNSAQMKTYESYEEETAVSCKLIKKQHPLDNYDIVKILVVNSVSQSVFT